MIKFLVILFSILETFAKAFVLVIMWEWFLVPVGFPNVSFGLALGCVFSISLISGISFEDIKERTIEDTFLLIVIRFINSIVTLGFGFVIKSLMA